MNIDFSLSSQYVEGFFDRLTRPLGNVYNRKHMVSLQMFFVRFTIQTLGSIAAQCGESLWRRDSFTQRLANELDNP